MNTLLLEEGPYIDGLFPFALTRSIVDIRIGILTIREKWERLASGRFAVRTAGRGELHSPDRQTGAGFTIPGNILPARELVEAICQGLEGIPRQHNQGPSGNPGLLPDLADALSKACRIERPWHIFQLNERVLVSDYKLLTEGRKSQAIPATVQAVEPGNIFIEEGARLSHAVLNASTGPIYIGRNAEIMEGALIRGPFALCEGAAVKMGATIYGATTIGPYSVAGGEIKNSVLFGYSNKAHHGYLGDSVIGEWCNLGAGTSNSNVKNSAEEVRVWDHASRQFVGVGLKCGLLMGDYSRSAINTAFNTGTVVGVCCSLFGEGGLMPKYIPSFSWGMGGESSYSFDKALRDIANWKKLKNQSLRDDEIQTLKHIFELP